MTKKILSKGRLVYGPSYRLVALVDKELVRYYLALIPKCKNVWPQAYPPHITIVRNRYETPTNLGEWGKYKDYILQFSYIPRVYWEGPYFYLRVYSDTIGRIRRTLGLPEYRTNFKSYHITIGNTKHETSLVSNVALPKL